MTHNQSLRTCNFPLEDLIRFLQTPKDAEIYRPFKVVGIIGLYHMFCSYGCLIPVDCWIPIRCNTFL